MATMTGANLLASIIKSTGVEVNALVTATLSAKLQQMIDNGTYSKLAASIAMSGFSTTVNAATEISDLSDAVETNAGLIEAAADQDAVDLIDFPPVGDVPTPASLSIADMTVAEDGANVTFTVTLAGDAPAAGESVTVDYTTADGTATAGDDYTATSGTLTFGEGVSTQTITVPITDDLIVDADETFTVVLSNAAGTVGANTATISDDTATGTITDNDVVVPIDSYTLTADTASVTEGNAVTFTATALDADGNPAAVSVDTTFNYQIAGIEVAGGTADPATDLGKVTGTVTILAGQSTGTFTLTPSDDGVTEGFEGFKVSMLDDSFVSVAESGNVVIKDGAEAGQTFTLTTSTDSLTGTSGGDTFNGVLASGGDTGTTVAPGDSINGGDGTDTLTIAVSGDVGSSDHTLQAVSTSNLEKVYISNFDTDAAFDNIIDTTLMTGLTNVGMSSSSSTGDTQFTNLKNTVEADMQNGSGDLTVSYTASVVSGSSDTQVLNVANVTGGTFTANSVETVSVATSLADSSLDAISANSIQTLNASGSNDLTIVNALDFQGTGSINGTVDASTMTGNLKLNLSTAENIKVAGGEGDDTFVLAESLNKSDTINGGSGNDTLSLSIGAVTYDATASTGELVNISNIETIRVSSSDTTNNSVLDLDNTTGVTKVEVGGELTVTTTETADTSDVLSLTLNGQTISVTVADGTNASTVNDSIVAAINAANLGILATDGGNDITLTATTADSINLGTATNTTAAARTVTFATKANTDDHAMTINNMAAGQSVTILGGANNAASAGTNIGAQAYNLKDASGTSDELSINLSADTSSGGNKSVDHDVDSITIANVETLNLDSSDLAATKTQSITTLTGGTALKTINITGDTNLTIGTLTAANVATVNASTFTGDLEIDGVDENQTITTGTGNDTIIMGTELDNNDTIDAGGNTVLSDGTAGSDKVEGTITNATATTGALKIANAEQIELTNTGAAVIDAAGITGTSDIQFAGAASSTSVTNLSTDASIGLGHKDEGGAAFTGTTTVALADETGAADSLTVNLYDVSTNTVKASGIENVTFALSATDTTITDSTTLNVSALNASTINVTGANADTDHTLILGTLDTDTTTVDASGHKGELQFSGGSAVSMTVSSDATAADSITLSSGNDTVTMTGNMGTVAHTLVGGDGTDILNATVNSTATDFTNVSGFETINLTVANSTATGFDDETEDNGLDAATTVNVTGGNSLSTFTVGTAASFADQTTFNAVDFAGAVDITIKAGEFDTDVNISAGATTSDKVRATILTGENDIIGSMSGVETLVVTSDEAVTAGASLDISKATGLSTIEAKFDNASNDDLIHIKGIASGVGVKVTSTETADKLVLDLTDHANADNSLNLELTSVTSGDVLDLDVAGLETLNVTTKTAATGTILDLAGVAATGTGKTTLTLAGAGAITLNSLNTDINVVNASSTTGAVTLAAAQRDADALTFTGGSGNDAVAMENKSDALDGASGSDTLSFDYTAILGGIEIDLSQSGDQITSMDGSSNSAVQTGFENVNLSGFKGFGAVVVGSTGDNVIYGTDKADNLNGGAGTDTLNLSTLNVSATTDDGIAVNVSGSTVATLANSMEVADGSSTAGVTGLATGKVAFMNDATSGSENATQELDTISNFEKYVLSSEADQFYGGTGNETVTGGAGADVIDFMSGDDTWVVANNSGGSTVAGSSADNANLTGTSIAGDLISNWTGGAASSDVISFSGVTLTGSTAALKATVNTVATAVTGDISSVDAGIIEFTTAESAAGTGETKFIVSSAIRANGDNTNDDVLHEVFSDLKTLTVAANSKHIVVVNDGTNNAFFLIEEGGGNTNMSEAGDSISLLGVIAGNTDVATGDFVIS